MSPAFKKKDNITIKYIFFNRDNRVNSEKTETHSKVLTFAKRNEVIL